MNYEKKRKTSPKPSVCVCCASSDDVPDIYMDSARKLGVEIAARGMRLIYGGGNNGLMGVLSEKVHVSGGDVVGVITGDLKGLGYAYKDADEMIVAGDMRDRKAIMEQRADGFIGLAGGFGTLEEMLEIITMKQLEIHNKPIVLLNTGNFFSGLLDQFERAYEENFIGQECRELYHVTSSVKTALEYIADNQC